MIHLVSFYLLLEQALQLSTKQGSGAPTSSGSASGGTGRWANSLKSGDDDEESAKMSSCLEKRSQCHVRYFAHITLAHLELLLKI